MARLEQHPVKPALRTTCEDCNVKPAVRPPLTPYTARTHAQSFPPNDWKAVHCMQPLRSFPRMRPRGSAKTDGHRRAGCALRWTEMPPRGRCPNTWRAPPALVCPVLQGPPRSLRPGRGIGLLRRLPRAQRELFFFFFALPSHVVSLCRSFGCLATTTVAGPA